MSRFAQFFFLFTTLFLIGCSTSSTNPINPFSQPDDSILTDESLSLNGNNSLWGQWIIEFDLEKMEARVIPLRESEYHIGITGYLPTPTIHVNSYDPIMRVLDVDVTISNPFNFPGYDVRGIVFTDDVGHVLLNADDWTNLFDIPGGRNINPFKAYAKEVLNRRFGAHEQHTEQYILFMPDTPIPIRYAIEASWPSNCQEPYSLENFSHGPIYDDIGASCDISIDVFDWQDDASDVTIAAQILTGEPVTHLVLISNNTWGATITNQTGLPIGTYEFIVTAVSSDSVALYDYVTMTVTEKQELTDWTILIYLHESNLGEYAIQDMNEMEVAGSRDEDLNIIVLWDKTDNPDDVMLRIAKDPAGFNYDLISPEIDDGGLVIPPEGLDMGDGRVLERFLRWAMDNYPAQHYGLDLWDHGDGPFGIVPETGFIRSCCNGLSIWEIKDACAAALAAHPETDKLDFIGFDACLMSWIETAYCLRNVSKATIGSEMTEPGDGWFYTTPLTYLLDNIETCDYKAICEQIVIAYLDSTSMWEDCTLAASDNGLLVTSVIPALNDFAVELKNALGSYYNTIYTCWESSGDWGAWCWEYDVKDLGYFCQLVSAQSGLPSSLKTKATTLKDAIAGAMIERGHTGSGSGCPWNETGWQIWFTPEYFDYWNDYKREDYVRLEFTETSWDEFLEAFY